MGLIGAVLRMPAAVLRMPAAGRVIGAAVTWGTGVVTPMATQKLAADRPAAPADQGGEDARPGLFDRFVNGLNRLPRPMLALGTLGLFLHAMIDPAGFEARMVGLKAMPEPLWWLLGAVVSFYFGAREFHYSRTRAAATPSPKKAPP